MANPNRLGIEMLTLLGMPPVDYVRLAGELGCATVSTGLSGLPLAMFGITDFAPYPAWSLRDDPALRRETRAAMRDHGVGIGLGEGFRADAGLDVGSFAADLDLMAELGAVRINAIGIDPDLARCHDQLAVLSAMAIERGMDFTVEFCPGFSIDTLDKVLALIAHIGRGQCRVLIDSMHFLRHGGTPEQIAALDPDLIGYAQLADAPPPAPDENYMTLAMFARGVPGTGALPLREFVAALPAGVPVSVEVPRLDDLRTIGPRAHAARVVEAARGLGA
jgi:sugar phosphate isomerase/epimerase